MISVWMSNTFQKWVNVTLSGGGPEAVYAPLDARVIERSAATIPWTRLHD